MFPWTRRKRSSPKSARAFSATSGRVETEAEARAFLDEMRKKYYDARHNCWCYVLHEGGVVRYGDDGEPQGTAGQPMLNVFQREGVENVVLRRDALFRRRAARRGRTDARLRKVREGRA